MCRVLFLPRKATAQSRPRAGVMDKSMTIASGLAFRTELGAIGVWIGLSCGTAVYAVLLILRFRRLAGHLERARMDHAN